jgi:hypothetical protein
MYVYIYYILVNSSWRFHQLAAGQLLPRQPVWYGKCGRYSLSITYNITSAGSLSSNQTGRPPCWASPLAFGLTGPDGIKSGYDLTRTCLHI